MRHAILADLAGATYRAVASPPGLARWSRYPWLYVTGGGSPCERMRHSRVMAALAAAGLIQRRGCHDTTLTTPGEALARSILGLPPLSMSADLLRHLRARPGKWLWRSDLAAAGFDLDLVGPPLLWRGWAGVGPPTPSHKPARVAAWRSTPAGLAADLATLAAVVDVPPIDPGARARAMAAFIAAAPTLTKATS